MKMLVTEWDYDLEKEVIRDEAREDGREEERAILVKSLYENGMTVAQIVKGTNLSETVIKKILGL
jgi:DNA invertase Pin-like site-specific DNA recombinase